MKKAGNTVLEDVERLIAQDVGKRGICQFYLHGELRSVADALLRASKIAVITGFIIITDDGPKAETDGPLGTAVVVRALLRLEKEVVVITDGLNRLVVVAALSSMGVDCPVYNYEDGIELDDFLLLSIERPARAEDGNYYSMRGEDISTWVAPIDELFLGDGPIGAAIGDGGNEIGMGKIRDRLQEVLEKRYLSTVPSRYLIVSGVSNWGAYGVVSGLELLSGVELLHTPREERKMLEAVLDAGAVDGIKKDRQLSVDGIKLSVHQDMLKRLKAMITCS